MSEPRHRYNLSVPALSMAQWQVRHRIVLGSLALPMAVFFGFLVKGDVASSFATTYMLLVTLQAILSMSPRIAPKVRQIFASGCLFTACAVLVEASGRAPATHLFFAVAVCMLALYQDVVVYLGAVGFLAIYHLGLGMLSPGFIYPPTLTPELAVAWSFTFFLVAVFTSFVGVLTWFLNSRSSRESESLKVALTEAAVRERQARDLNDTVVQHLATAVYAAEMGDTATAATAATEGLTAARKLVASLLAPGWLHDHVFLRDTPSQGGAQQ